MAMKPSAFPPTDMNSIETHHFTPNNADKALLWGSMQARVPPGYSGGPLVHSYAQSGVAISICGQCGVVAPLHGNSCEVCKRPLAEVRTQAPPQSPDHTWVAVRAAFSCNSCRFLAPLDSLDADGAVECAHCGLRQRFETEEWRPALAFAHAVGDLAGPHPEGRNPHPVLWIGSENPHTSTGSSRTFEHGTFGALALDASPGHPVCEKCHLPLAVSVPRPGAVETSCPKCGDRTRHQISDAAIALCPALVAAVSEEHRNDQPKARAQATAAGVLALSCPSCGAPLEIQQTGTVHTCRYCRTTCVVPHTSVARALRQTPEPSVWWLFFQGLSDERRALLDPPALDAAGLGEGAKKALALLKLRSSKEPLREAPGVYEAPEQQGFNSLQFFVTLGLGTLALLIGLVLAGLMSNVVGK